MVRRAARPHFAGEQAAHTVVQLDGQPARRRGRGAAAVDGSGTTRLEFSGSIPPENIGGFQPSFLEMLPKTPSAS